MEDITFNETALSFGTTQKCMIDLHGYSVQRTRESINRQIAMASQVNISSFRFVTGRGNHVNAQGERGTLYRGLPSWLSEEALSKIESIKKGDGYYDIEIKPSTSKQLPGLLGEHITQQYLSDNFDSLKKIAEKEDADSQYLLGHCYQFGVGCDSNPQTAVYWYKKSANSNNPFAQYALGGCYWQGVGIRQDDQKAIELFKKAAEQDLVWVIEQLGDIYYNGYGVNINQSQAKNYYQKAADLGSLTAKRKLAHIHYFDAGSEEDKKLAFILYKEIADKGDAHAAFNVACVYFEGTVIQQDYSLAFHYAKKAADENDPDAQYLLFVLYLKGLGTVKDARLSLEYLKRAADNNFKIALFELARHPSTNKKGERIHYMIKAAKAGHINAQAFIISQLQSLTALKILSEDESASLHKNFWKQDDKEVLTISDMKLKYEVLDRYLRSPNLTKKQKAKILRLLVALVKKDEPMACRRLGGLYAYAEHDIVNKDANKAEQYWLQGAALHDSHCLCALGYYYEEKATHEAAHYKKAFEYHERAMKLGSANSCVQIGTLYRYGHGVKKDINKAIEYFHKAIELDDEKVAIQQRDSYFYKPILPCAAYNLACVYVRGDEGFPNDYHKATHWFTISANAGDLDAKKVLEQLGLSAQLIKNDNLPNTDAGLLNTPVSFWKTSANPITDKKSALMAQLIEFAECLKLAIDWKISKQDMAWGYIEANEVLRLKHDMLKPFTIEKTKDGKQIILLKNISNVDLAAVVNKIKAQLEISSVNQARLS